MNAHAGPPRPFFSSLVSSLLRLPGRLWSLPRHVLSFVRRSLLPTAVGLVAAVLMVLGLAHLPRLHPDLPLLPSAPVLGFGILAGVYSGFSAALLRTVVRGWKPPSGGAAHEDSGTARRPAAPEPTPKAPGVRHTLTMFSVSSLWFLGGQVWQSLDTWTTRAVFLVAVSPFVSVLLFLFVLGRRHRRLARSSRGRTP